jgi:opacity protein-like surface antigen
MVDDLDVPTRGGIFSRHFGMAMRLPLLTNGAGPRQCSVSMRFGRRSASRSSEPSQHVVTIGGCRAAHTLAHEQHLVEALSMKLVDGPATRHIVLCLLAGLLAAVAPARVAAAPLFGQFYLALDGGVVALDDSTINYNGAQPNFEVPYDGGWAVSGAAGLRVLDFYRLELEISHRENDVSNGYWCCYGSNGSTHVTAYMVNGYYDFPFYAYAGFVPFIGLGVGRAQISQNVQFSDGTTLANSNGHALAYQVIGGLEFPLIPRRLATTLEFRYLGSSGPTFHDVGGFAYKSDYNSYTFMVGLRYGL